MKMFSRLRDTRYFSFMIFVPARKTIPPTWYATDRHNFYD